MPPGDPTKQAIEQAATARSGRERLSPLERTLTMSLALAALPGGAPPAPTTQSFAEGVQVAGRYRVVRFVARGGMGEVYEAHDLVLSERVALKSIRQGAATERAVDRFRREVQLARRVTHPNVCRIFDVGVHEGVSFLSMEFLAGQTLSERLDRVGALPVAEARPLVEQIAAGLAAAHAEGIVHRDLKSGNVMLVESARGERVVITDFGLAKLAVSDEAADAPHDLTTGAGIAGSPAYMAPEQVVGGPVTPAADVYALGVVMYELCTGRLPFVADTPLATAVMRLHQDPPSPRALQPGLDERWERAIRRCLQREPAARFPDAAAVGAAIADDAPADADAVAEPPRARTRRRVAMFAGIGLGVAVGIALPVVLAYVRPARPAAAAHDAEGERRMRIMQLAVQRIGEGRYQIDRPMWLAWLDDPDEHGRTCRLMPSVRDGRVIGFKIYALQTGSLLDRLGFQNGDTITTIAGIEMASSDRYGVAREQTLHDAHVMITFLRAGAPAALELTLVDPEPPSGPTTP